jgi:hypothetical protein
MRNSQSFLVHSRWRAILGDGQLLPDRFRWRAIINVQSFLGLFLALLFVGHLLRA